MNGHSLVDRFIVGGWQANGIFVAQSGLPFTVTINGTATIRAPAPAGRTSFRGRPVSGNQTISNWFNPAAFTSPTAYNYGDVGRNTLRGPRERTWMARWKNIFPSRKALHCCSAWNSSICSITLSSRYRRLRSMREAPAPLPLPRTRHARFRLHSG